MNFFDAKVKVFSTGGGEPERRLTCPPPQGSTGTETCEHKGDFFKIHCLVTEHPSTTQRQPVRPAPQPTVQTCEIARAFEELHLTLLADAKDDIPVRELPRWLVQIAAFLVHKLDVRRRTSVQELHDRKLFLDSSERCPYGEKKESRRLRHRRHRNFTKTVAFTLEYHDG